MCLWPAGPHDQEPVATAAPLSATAATTVKTVSGYKTV